MAVPILLLGAGAANAATIPVTTLTDEFDAASNGKCSLREAVEAADNNAPKGGCPAGTGSDVIQLKAGRYELTQNPGPEASGSFLTDRRDLDIVDADTTIKGAGREATVIDSNGLDRVIHADATVTKVSLSNLTLTGGHVFNFIAAAGGAGINVPTGDLMLDHVAITDNRDSTPTAFGGGVLFQGDGLTITDSVISGNHVDDGNGGGIAVDLADTLDITRTTISGNGVPSGVSGGEGGGAFVEINDRLTIHDSTFSGNSARDEGGLHGYAKNELTIENSTFTGNVAGNDGAGLRTDSNDALIKSSTIAKNASPFDANLAVGCCFAPGPTREMRFESALIADPTTTDDSCDLNPGVTVISRGGNLDDGHSCGFSTSAGDQINTDPKLGPPAANGGPTMTLALLKGSKAINRGKGCPDLDQRGAPRSKCDVGAYERVLCGGVAVNLIGTAGKDRLIGGSGRDGILGLSGNDVLKGKGGGDGLCGGGGKDRLSGGGGKDKLLGQAGADILRGGPGRDKLKGGPGRDRLHQ